MQPVDHYRTLGIAPTADDAVIRAVYLALMKRFHPDRSATASDHQRAREINEAYAVLSDPARRAAYDDERAELRPWERGAVLAPPRRRTNFSGAVVLAGALGAAMALYAYWPQIGEPRRGTGARAPIASTPARCASLADPERVRAALIVRLDEIGVLDRAAAGALTAARFELGPATDARDLAAPGEVACLATLEITLPAQFRTAAGQGTILSELNYSVSRTDPALGIAVQPDGTLIAALSAIRHQPSVPVSDPMLDTEARVEEVPMPRVEEARVEPVSTARPATRPPRIASAASPAPPRPAQTASPPTPRAAAPARPKIDLGRLEQQTAGLYSQSLRNAASDKQRKLAQSQGAFTARLNSCGSDSCRRDAYLARNVEISQIMMGQ